MKITSFFWLIQKLLFFWILMTCSWTSLFAQDDQLLYNEQYIKRTVFNVQVTDNSDPSKWSALELNDMQEWEIIDSVSIIKDANAKISVKVTHMSNTANKSNLAQPKFYILSNSGIQVYSAENELYMDIPPEQLANSQLPGLSLDQGLLEMTSHFNFTLPDEIQIEKWANQGWIVESVMPEMVYMKRDFESQTIDLVNKQIHTTIVEDGLIVGEGETYYQEINGSYVPILDVNTMYHSLENGDCAHYVHTTFYSDYSITQNVANRKDEDETSNFNLAVYPNPAHDNLSIFIPEVKPGNQLYVVDHLGKVVVAPREQFSNFHDLSIVNLSPGNYLLVYKTTKKVETTSFTKL